MTARFLVLLVWLVAAACSFAQQQEDPFARQREKPPERGAAPPAPGIAFTAEWIELELNAMPALLRKHGGEEDSSALYAAVESLIEAGEARRAEVVYGRLREGSRTKIESIEELIYPTEYDPPEIPINPSIDNEEVAKALRTPANPTAFETRNVGTTVEVDPSVSANGKSIQLNLAPETVTFLGRDYHVPEDGAPDASLLRYIWQPRFYTSRIDTVIAVESGSTVLVGSFNRPVALEEEAPESEKRLLLFVHAKSLPVSAKQ